MASLSTFQWPLGVRCHQEFLPMAIPSKMLWMESARTMTKLRMEDRNFFSLAAALNTGFFFFGFLFLDWSPLLLLREVSDVDVDVASAAAAVDSVVVEPPFSRLRFWSSRLSNSEESEMKLVRVADDSL